MKKFRILVTGSRDWDNRDLVYQTLNQTCQEYELNFTPDEYGNTMPDSSRLTVVHGQCPTGADFIADEWCIGNDFLAERHPANWHKYGKRAGFVRNDEMVKLGADLCIAFIKNGSRGATMTASLAIKAGIETRIILP